ncbi:MAG: T9SS type A sorting domain-containing protein [Urechidicola sp.]|nr:T9SS type A sorting domain-containing protein [Urechidicola sp.]
MNCKVFLLLILFFTLQIKGQTNGWHQYAKPANIYKIEVDDTNINLLHLGTDTGYVQFNTATNQVTDFLNITTQNPPVGIIQDIALNPTNDDVALALKDGFAIYDGTTVTKHAYHNSDLTIGELTNKFIALEMSFGQGGELYIFKEDVAGYQIFNNGVFETEVTTAFTPTDIIENNAGTKVFFAGDNSGLWELDKATDTFTNYTTSNSDLVSNFLMALDKDINDNVYVGSYGGLNTVSAAGIFNSYQQLIPPANTLNYPVSDIDINETTGLVLVNNSQQNGFSYGVSQVDLQTNTWTNFTDDNTNCLNVNRLFDAVVIPSSGEICGSKIFTRDSDLYFFNPTTNTCNTQDINFLVASDISLEGYSRVNVRPSNTTGSFDIGFTNFDGDLEILEIPKSGFDGNFSTPTKIDAPAGGFFYDILEAGDYFVISDNFGNVNFVDENENTTSTSLNLPAGVGINVTKRANRQVTGNTVDLVCNSYEGINTKVFATQCDLNTSTCDANPIELFTTNRDVTQPIRYSIKKAAAETYYISAIKTNAAGELAITQEEVSIQTKTLLEVNFDVGIDTLGIDPASDPIYLGNNNAPFFALFNTPGLTSSSDYNAAQPEFNTQTVDDNNNGALDRPVNNFQVNLENPEPIDLFKLALMMMDKAAENNTGSLRRDISYAIAANQELAGYRSTNTPLNYSKIDEASIENLPEDIYLYSATSLVYSSTKFALILYTSYGLLIKSDIDYSSFLSVEENDLTTNKVNIYPNPSSNIITIDAKQFKSVSVFDLNGRIVLESEKEKINVSELANGIYLAKIKLENNAEVSKKLIVK